MRCRDIIALSTEYVDGELDERRASALRGHLRLCESCLHRVQDEAALRDAADDLGPVDPPPTLWANVQRGLAEAEIADSRRSRLWLWGPQLRQALLPAAVAVAAAAALLIYLRRGEPEVAETRPVPAVRSTTPAIEPTPAPEPTFAENLAAEIDRADGTYRSAIRELSEQAAAERANWSARSAARYDVVVATFENNARTQLRRLAVANTRPDSRTRDSLYSLYQSHIRFLQRATMGEVQ